MYFPSVMIFVFAFCSTSIAAVFPALVVEPVGETQVAPHGEGNVYAPEVMHDNGLYRMWFGGQGRDGHDRIHLAESDDGIHWRQRGVVLEDAKANHVNDPSVVKVDGKYFMYYTRAAVDVSDDIVLATSNDGVHWKQEGVVLEPGKPGAWDSLLVGRPSVLFEDGQFRMWYDGRKDLPLGAPATGVPKSASSTRAVGYAESSDGLQWTRREKPVYEHDAGGVHVARLKSGYAMVYEGHAGTQLATSPDGIAWTNKGVWVPASGNEIDRFGHVTPFLLVTEDQKPVALFFGAARAGSWDRNTIGRRELSPVQQKTVLVPTSGGERR